MKQYLRVFIWGVITTSILLIIFGVENVEKWLSKPVTEIRIADLFTIILYVLSFIYIFYDNNKK